MKNEQKYHCYNCDGLVGEDETVCPHCGVSGKVETHVEEKFTSKNGYTSLNGCQLCAIIIAILGFIGGLGIYGTLGVYGLIIAWLSTFITFEIIYGIGKIINYTNAIKEYTQNILECIENSKL